MIDAIIDLSHHNGVVDFHLVRATGVLGVFGKASQGLGYVDPAYERNAAEARNVGLMWGAYHFGINADGAAQAEHFLSVSGTDPTTLLALDFEPNTTFEGTMTVDQARAFVSRIHQITGRWPGLYGGSLIRQALGQTHDEPLAQCWLWLSQYGPTAKVPANWPSWSLWQYTPHGEVAGVKGDVDRSRFNGKAPQLRRLWGVIG
jgi:lysozyme